MDVKPGFINTGMTIDGTQQPTGYTARFDHYESWCVFWTKEIYEITLLTPPLIYVDNQGAWWTTDRHYFSDFGSVPPPLQSIPGLDRERHKFPYMFHDSGYNHKGLWRSTDCGRTWIFIARSRKEMDDMLAEMCENDVEPGGALNRGTIWTGVRIFGGPCYGLGDYEKRDPPPPVARLDTSKLPIAFA